MRTKSTTRQNPIIESDGCLYYDDQGNHQWVWDDERKVRESCDHHWRRRVLPVHGWNVVCCKCGARGKLA